MQLVSKYFGEWSWVKSLLLKGSLLAMGIAIVLWVGWPEPLIKNLDHSSSSVMPSVSHSVQKVHHNPTGHASTLLDLNASSRMDLEKLPGIGSVLADRIVSYRSIHGDFHQITDLVKVSGIGVKRLHQLEPFVTVESIGGDMHLAFN